MKKGWLNKEVLTWSLFDFANSSYATIIVAFVYAIYFKKVVAMDTPASDFYWSTGINISMIIVAILSPLLGAAADRNNSKKKYLIFFTMLCVVTTALLFFVREGMVIRGLVLFILSNIGFQAGLGFYDAFLKDITEEKFYNIVSSFGYAIGYAGSLLALGVVIIFKDKPPVTFAACALIFLIFSLPLFILIKEKKIIQEKSNEGFIGAGFKRIKDTFNHIRKYDNIKKFLLSYFLYIDGVNTIIFFSAIYAQKTLYFTISELILFFIIVQITALGGSLLFSYIAKITNTKKALIIIIVLWALVTISVFFSNDKTSFLVIGGFAGILLGSSQALSRSFFSLLIPDEKKTEFFGFFSLFEKTSTLLGPLTFGLVSWLTGNQRYAVISILVFFIAGLLLFGKVKQPEVERH